MPVLNKLKTAMEGKWSPELLSVKSKVSMATIMRARAGRSVSKTSARLIAQTMKLKENDLTDKEDQREDML